MRNLIVGLAKQPIVHFIVVGAILGFALQWLTGEVPGEDETTIRISATDVARLDAGWRARYNRAPTPDGIERARPGPGSGDRAAPGSAGHGSGPER